MSNEKFKKSDLFKKAIAVFNENGITKSNPLLLGSDKMKNIFSQIFPFNISMGGEGTFNFFWKEDPVIGKFIIIQSKNDKEFCYIDASDENAINAAINSLQEEEN